MKKPRLNIAHKNVKAFFDSNHEWDRKKAEALQYIKNSIGHQLPDKIYKEVNNIIEAKVGKFDVDKLKNAVREKYSYRNSFGTLLVKYEYSEIYSKEIEQIDAACNVRLNSFGDKKLRWELILNTFKKYVDLYEDETEAKLYDLIS